jgi:hypothetical protein
MPDMHAKALRALSALALLCACPTDKDEESGPETGASSSGDPSTGGATTGATDPTTGGSTEVSGSTASESTASETSADETTAGETTAGPVECSDLKDEASCNAVVHEESRCEWRLVEPLTLDMCVFGEGQARCVEISINDGGCSPCRYKDLGGGQFEVIRGDEDFPGCQFMAEFQSCYYFEPGQDPPVCACMCPEFQP